MKARAPERIAQIVLASVLVLGTTGFAVGRWLDRAHDAGLTSGYEPSPDVPRIPFAGFPVDGALYIRDFDAAGDDLYLLDMAGLQVLKLRRDGSQWTVASSFGRGGNGPGELRQPTGIAVTDAGATVIVSDQNRLHFFTDSGTHVRTRALTLPCALMSPRVSSAKNGLLLSGRCTQADTVFAVLFHVDDRDLVTRIAQDPVYSVHGESGSILAAATMYSDGVTAGLFGSGTGDCVYRIDPGTSPPGAARICGLAGSRYAFVASPEFRSKAKAIAASRPSLAGSLAIPEMLPVYLERMDPGNGTLLLRPVTNDTLVFRRAGADADVAVAPVEGLVGCRAAGCLWVQSDSIPYVMLVPAAHIARLAAAH
jgi:hypothetical protein